MLLFVLGRVKRLGERPMDWDPIYTGNRRQLTPKTISSNSNCSQTPYDYCTQFVAYVFATNRVPQLRDYPIYVAEYLIIVHKAMGLSIGVNVSSEPVLVEAYK